jgi:hypothetical protein
MNPRLRLASLLQRLAADVPALAGHIAARRGSRSVSQVCVASTEGIDRLVRVCLAVLIILFDVLR